MNRIDAAPIGPGSYETRSNLNARSPVYHNAPRHIIPKGIRDPNLFLSDLLNSHRLGHCSPSPNNHNPNFDLLFPKHSVPKFGTSQRSDYFSQAKFRSPGPVYTLPNPATTATSFGYHKSLQRNYSTARAKNNGRSTVITKNKKRIMASGHLYAGTSVYDTRKLFDSRI